MDKAFIGSIEQEILECFQGMTPREQQMTIGLARALKELDSKGIIRKAVTDQVSKRFMSLAADATEDDFKGLWIQVLTMKEEG